VIDEGEVKPQAKHLRRTWALVATTGTGSARLSDLLLVVLVNN
jgi:hypothetical protein